MYSIAPASESAGELTLTAYAVAGNEPLALVLTATGDLTGMSRPRQEGLYDDRLTMVQSATAISHPES